MESEISECNVSAVLTQMLETLSGVRHNEVGGLGAAQGAQGRGKDIADGIKEP